MTLTTKTINEHILLSWFCMLILGVSLFRPLSTRYPHRLEVQSVELLRLPLGHCSSLVRCRIDPDVPPMDSCFPFSIADTCWWAVFDFKWSFNFLFFPLMESFRTKIGAPGGMSVSSGSMGPFTFRLDIWVERNFPARVNSYRYSYISAFKISEECSVSVLGLVAGTDTFIDRPVTSWWGVRWWSELGVFLSAYRAIGRQ